MVIKFCIVFSSIIFKIIMILHLFECSVKIDENRIHDSIISNNYDPTLPPKLAGKPVRVDVSVFILNIRSIKETELTYVVDIFYHQYWDDYRLQSNTTDNLVLDSSWKTKLWIPDSYFKNALAGQVPHIIFPTQYFVISNKTRVFMASRVSLQLSCEMEFSNFPHDSQECYIDIMSLSQYTDTVLLYWKDFSLTQRLHMTQFYVSEYSSENSTKTYAIGKFSLLRGRIVLTRQLGLYVLKNYIPSTLIVIMSFVGFWIPISAYPARVALVITALLALITQQYQSSQVEVSYVIALNVWMIICIAFVFLALIEYAIAITYHDRISAKQNNRINAENQISNTNENNESKKPNKKWFKVYAIIGFKTDKNRIDMISKYLFPFGFVFCLLMYLFKYAFN